MEAMEILDSEKARLFDERVPAWLWDLRHGERTPERSRVRETVARVEKFPARLAAASLDDIAAERRMEPGAMIAFFSGVLSVLLFLLGYAGSAFFYSSFVFALLSAALGIFSYSGIRSSPLALKGSGLALAGAIIGSVVVAIFLGWFAFYGLNISVDVLRRLTATAIA
jgi:hypothetical protein